MSGRQHRDCLREAARMERIRDVTGLDDLSFEATMTHLVATTTKMLRADRLLALDKQGVAVEAQHDGRWKISCERTQSRWGVPEIVYVLDRMALFAVVCAFVNVVFCYVVV